MSQSDEVATLVPLRVRRWVRWMTIVNVATIVLSIALSFGRMGSVSMLFPQVSGTIAFPGVGITIIAIALVISSIFALIGPSASDPWWRRLYAGMTMSGFVVAVICFAIGLLLLGAGLS